VAGTDQNFRLDEFADTMRSRIVSVFTDALATANVPALDVASRYGGAGRGAAAAHQPGHGRQVRPRDDELHLENVSVPPEVEQAIDKRSSMGGHRQPQRLREVPDGARPWAPAAKAPRPLPCQRRWPWASAWRRSAAPVLDVLTPEQAAQALGVSVEDVMASINAGELKARKIGSAWRIAKSALDAFLQGA
jgi:excisionase family DNA binding protein